MHFFSAFIRKKLSNSTTHRAIVSRIINGHDHNTHLIATKSSNQPLSIGSGYNNERYKRVDSLIESLKSGIVVVGLSLGLCYFNYKSLTNSHFVYAYSESDKSTESGKKPTYIFPDSYRRKVFFKYKKRIRTQSPPEKVFEYFASYQSPEGEPYMTPADLMRAMVPVFSPYEASRVREGSLKGELGPSELHCPPEFFMLFDTNNDGLISFAEEIDKEEFKKVMELMRAQHRQGVRHWDGLRNGLKVSRTIKNGGLLEYFFGKDGKSRLAYGKFVQFLKDLHNEILSLEFAHYDYKSKGTISAKHFALSMVASADMGHINKFLDRVEELNDEPSLKNIRITLDDFMKFAELRTQLRPLSLAIFSYGKVNGLLTKKDFQRATEQVCGIALNDNVIDIIYYLFDVNRDGRLSSDEFLRVLHRREEDKLQPREAGLIGLISCWLQCSRSNCSTSRILF